MIFNTIPKEINVLKLHNEISAVLAIDGIALVDGDDTNLASQIRIDTNSTIDEETIQQIIDNHVAMDYIELRKINYPSVDDQLDAIWHAMDNNIIPKIEPMYSDCLLVKLEYPKPTTDK